MYLIISIVNGVISWYYVKWKRDIDTINIFKTRFKIWNIPLFVFRTATAVMSNMYCVLLGKIEKKLRNARFAGKYIFVSNMLIRHLELLVWWNAEVKAIDLKICLYDWDVFDLRVLMMLPSLPRLPVQQPMEQGAVHKLRNAIGVGRWSAKVNYCILWYGRSLI